MRVKKSEGKRGGGVVWLGSAAVLRASVRRPSSLGSGQSEREKQVVHEKNRPPPRCPSSSTAKTAGVHAASNRVAARLQIGFQDVKREKKKKKGTQQPPGDRVGVRRRGIGISSHPCARASPLCTGAVGVCQLGAITGKNSASMPPPSQTHVSDETCSQTCSLRFHTPSPLLPRRPDRECIPRTRHPHLIRTTKAAWINRKMIRTCWR